MLANKLTCGVSGQMLKVSICSEVTYKWFEGWFDGSISGAIHSTSLLPPIITEAKFHHRKITIGKATKGLPTPLPFLLLTTSATTATTITTATSVSTAIAKLTPDSFQAMLSIFTGPHVSQPQPQLATSATLRSTQHICAWVVIQGATYGIYFDRYIRILFHGTQLLTAFH